MEFLNENKKSADCAIIAGYNAVKCLKKRANYRKIEHIAKKYYDYDSNWGLNNSKINNFLAEIEVNPKYMDCTIQNAYQEIKNKEGAIILYKHKNMDKWHLVFARNSKNGIKLYNSDFDFADLILGLQENELKVCMWTVEKVA